MDYEKFQRWFWNDEIWLGSNSTWEIIELNKKNSTLYYTKIDDMYYSLIIAAILMLFRYFLERFLKHILQIAS